MRRISLMVCGTGLGIGLGLVVAVTGLRAQTPAQLQSSDPPAVKRDSAPLPPPATEPTIGTTAPPTLPTLDNRSSPSLPGINQQPLEAVPATASGSATHDDPDQAATAYLEKARKDARESIEKLRAERLAIQKRLEKVDAALSRWEALLTALDPAMSATEGKHTFRPARATDATAAERGVVDPPNLPPTIPADPGPVRAPGRSADEPTPTVPQVYPRT